MPSKIREGILSSNSKRRGALGVHQRRKAHGSHSYAHPRTKYVQRLSIIDEGIKNEPPHRRLLAIKAWYFDTSSIMDPHWKFKVFTKTRAGIHEVFHMRFSDIDAIYSSVAPLLETSIPGKHFIPFIGKLFDSEAAAINRAVAIEESLKPIFSSENPSVDLLDTKLPLHRIKGHRRKVIQHCQRGKLV